MNDLERDLRALLDEDARRVPTPVAAPEGLRRSARRRQAVFGGVIALAGLAVVAGIVVGATTLLSQKSGPQPAAVPRTTGTMNGITITYPESWHLIDPDTEGLNGSPTMGESPLPRIVLALAPAEKPETFGCPGRANPGDAAPLLMTIQEEPLALDGPASTPWPAKLQPMSVDTSEAGCYLDWEFLRAGWTASGRTFEARVGFSPDASGVERDELFAAFSSMTFEASGGGVTSSVLGQGVAGGEPWTLFAERTEGRLNLSLEAESSGAGTTYITPPSSDLQPGSTILGQGSGRQLIAFGTVPTDVVRVEATAADGSLVQGEVFDIPDELEPGANAFAVVAAPGRLTIRGYDASGNVAARGSTGRAEAPSATGST